MATAFSWIARRSLRLSFAPSLTVATVKNAGGQTDERGEQVKVAADQGNDVVVHVQLLPAVVPDRR